MQPLKKIVFTLLLLGVASLVRAENPREFGLANELYDKGDFSGAQQRYESLIRSGNYSAALFYNLGNADYRLDHPGSAILNYERALMLDPSHPEARANLAFLRDKTGAKTEPRTWLDRLFPTFGLNRYAIVATIAGWITVFSLTAIILKFRTGTGSLWLITVSALLLLAYASSAIWYFDRQRTLAIVTADHARAQFAPADSSQIADTLPVGSRVRVLRERGEWTYCELPNGNPAWISTKSIEPVRLHAS
jgi:tetratricopeptide (TPR) repeat protein